LLANPPRNQNINKKTKNNIMKLKKIEKKENRKRDKAKANN
jgi:hypothetical protein